MLQQLARDGSGDRRCRQEPQQQPFFFLFFGGEVHIRAASFGEANHFSSQSGAHDLKPRPPEVEEHGEQSSEVESDIESEFVSGRKLVPAQQSPHDNQMGGTGDGNELCDSLHDGKNNSLIDWQVLVRRVSVGWYALLNVEDEALRAQCPTAGPVVVHNLLCQRERASFGFF